MKTTFACLSAINSLGDQFSRRSILSAINSLGDQFSRRSILIVSLLIFAYGVRSQTLETLHSFSGWLPQGKLLQTSDGNFYGTTDHGGADDAGTIFKITPSGSFTDRKSTRLN